MTEALHRDCPWIKQALQADEAIREAVCRGDHEFAQQIADAWFGKLGGHGGGHGAAPRLSATEGDGDG